MNIGLFAQHICSLKGGIERATARLSAWLAERGHHCVIYHWDRADGAPQYSLHPAVQTCPLPLHTPQGFARSRERLLADRPDVFCCALGSKHRTLFLQLFHNTGIPLLMSERVAPATVEKSFMPRRERLACFAGADGIHLLSASYLDSLPPFLRERATVIPNAAPPARAIDWSRREGPRKVILGVGRLEEPQKKFSLLFQAFAMLAKRFPDWDCHICGAGDARAHYERLVAGYGLTERVVLRGAVDDMDAAYASAGIFCMPSAYEGSPNALLEAQSYGLPSVGFADCGGVNDIIVDGENGFLLNRRTAAALAEVLAALMGDAQLRRRMSLGAQRLISRYDPEAIFSQWEALLARVAATKGQTQLNCDLAAPDGQEDVELCLRNLLRHDGAFEFRQNMGKILDAHRNRRRV
ncbi:MAG: glycosyltransferase [Desulfovibrio sp.]|nr:glycosyltransferase [Desulfovibrio sp.]